MTRRNMGGELGGWPSDDGGKKSALDGEILENDKRLGREQIGRDILKEISDMNYLGSETTEAEEVRTYSFNYHNHVVEVSLHIEAPWVSVAHHLVGNEDFSYKGHRISIKIDSLVPTAEGRGKLTNSERFKKVIGLALDSIIATTAQDGERDVSGERDGKVNEAVEEIIDNQHREGEGRKTKDFAGYFDEVKAGAKVYDTKSVQAGIDKRCKSQTPSAFDRAMSKIGDIGDPQRQQLKDWNKAVKSGLNAELFQVGDENSLKFNFTFVGGEGQIVSMDMDLSKVDGFDQFLERLTASVAERFEEYKERIKVAQVKWENDKKGVFPRVDLSYPQERMRAELELEVIKKLGELGFKDIGGKNLLNYYYLENVKALQETEAK